MPKPGVSVEIAADDRITRTLERINKRIEQMRAPAQRTQKALGKFAELSGLNKVGTGLDRMGQAAKGAFFSIGRILPVLGVLTSAASVDGVVRLATAWSGFGSRLGFSAQRIGITATSLQSLDGAARLAGSSSGSLESGMQALGQNMWDAVGGRAPEVVSAFAALHVNFRNANGSAKSVTEVLPQLSDAISRIKNPFAQAAVAAHFFGSASEDLLPFLRLSSNGIANYVAAAQHYGVTNQAGVVAANRLRMAQTELTLSVEGLGNSVAQSLEPVLTPVIHQMAEWIAHNRGWIATRITYYVQQFAGWLKSIDWNGVAAGADRVWKRLKAGVDAIGGLKTATEVFLGLWTAARLAPLAAAVASGGPIGMLVAAMASVAWATERTRNAWADFQERKRLTNDDPASDKVKARLPAFHPAPDQTDLHYTGRFLPTAMDSHATDQFWSGSAGKVDRAAAAKLFGGLETQDSLPGGMLDRLWNQESGRGQRMRSGAGALGHFQFMPDTARQYGVADPNDLNQSATGAGRYLRDLFGKYQDWNKAIAAYNWGPGNLDNDVKRHGADWLKHAPRETQGEVAYVVSGQRPSPLDDPNGFWNRAREDVSGMGRAIASGFRAAHQGPTPEMVSPGLEDRARGDLRVIAASAGFGTTAAPATVPPGTVGGGSLDATIERLRAELHITVATQQGLKATVKPGGSSGGLRVASVRTARAMDPEMTPGGY